MSQDLQTKTYAIPWIMISNDAVRKWVYTPNK